MQDHELTQLMYAETDDPPPAAINLARAMRAGRLLRRRRKYGPAFAAMAVLAVAGSTVAVTNGPNPAAAPRVTATSTAAPIPSLAPRSFDPLRLRLAVGWVPAGLNRADPTLATGKQQIGWSEPVAGRSPQRWVDVTIYAADLLPWQLASGTWTMQITESVRGAPAGWLVLPPKTTGSATRSDACGPVENRHEPGCASAPSASEHRPEALVWRWAPNAWAVTTVRETDKSAQRTIARSIAESVRTDSDESVRLPFAVKHPPAPLRLAAIEPHTPMPLYSVALHFGLGDDRITLVSLTGQNTQTLVTLTVTWVPPGYKNKDTPNRTLDGADAAVHFDSSEWGSITLYRNGYEVSLWISTRDGRRVIDEKTAIAIVTSVTPVPVLTDRTQWSITPLH